MKKLLSLLLLVFAITIFGCKNEKEKKKETQTIEETEKSASIPVTSDNYVQAETDWNFAGQQAQADNNSVIYLL